VRIVYLHGFASSPQSGKAQFFARKFAELGVAISIPRLDGGDFENLTISGQLNIAQDELAKSSEPAVVMGSSLGGYLAALLGQRHPQAVEKLILMAPAFHFLQRWRSRFSEAQLEAWKNHGTLNFFHYGEKRELPLRYNLIDDARQFAPEPAFSQPALIFHGVNDDVVPLSGSQVFASQHPNATLLTFPSGHELTDQLVPMWAAVHQFLKLEAMVD
jgi:pimeloyl-ACP methyl ester carboxylesterase